MKSRLRVLRAERGLTQEQLANAIGVSRQAIIAIEGERHDPSLNFAYRISAEFDLSVEEIFPNPHSQRIQA